MSSANLADRYVQFTEYMATSTYVLCNFPFCHTERIKCGVIPLNICCFYPGLQYLNLAQEFSLIVKLTKTTYCSVIGHFHIPFINHKFL
jgi:hypothetical protein